MYIYIYIALFIHECASHYFARTLGSVRRLTLTKHEKTTRNCVEQCLCSPDNNRYCKYHKISAVSQDRCIVSKVTELKLCSYNVIISLMRNVPKWSDIFLKVLQHFLQDL